LTQMIRRVSDVAGFEFIDENGGDPGVRLRKHQRKKSWSEFRLG
jgi:hypothetical protein